MAARKKQDFCKTINVHTMIVSAVAIIAILILIFNYSYTGSNGNDNIVGEAYQISEISENINLQTTLEKITSNNIVAIDGSKIIFDIEILSKESIEKVKLSSKKMTVDKTAKVGVIGKEVRLINEKYVLINFNKLIDDVDTFKSEIDKLGYDLIPTDLEFSKINNGKLQVGSSGSLFVEN